MANLAAGTLIYGRKGAVAIESVDNTNTRYVPVVSFSPTIMTNNSIVDLVNNYSIPTNKALGASFATIGMTMPFTEGVLNADFFNRAVLNFQADNGNIGYHTVTWFPQGSDADENADTYAKCKYTGLSISGQSSLNGQGSVLAVQAALNSYDPQSGSVSALATPTTGALSTGQLASFQDTSFSGVSNVVAFSLTMSTRVQEDPEIVAGTNTLYPYLCKGAEQTGLMGSLTITQKANPVTSLMTDGTISISIGKTTGSIVTFNVPVTYVSQTRNGDLGPLFWTTTYRVFSNAGNTITAVNS